MKQVQIIEDEPWLAERYQTILANAGYEVSFQPDVVAGMAAIDAKLPDVLILDVLLAATTAFTLLHELQSYSDTAKIPVILCTNLADELTLKDCKPYGVVAILDKATFVPADLVQAVREASHET